MLFLLCKALLDHWKLALYKYCILLLLLLLLLYGEAPQERVTFLGLQVYERVAIGISLPEVYKKVGKSVISIVKGQKGLTVEKTFWSCIFLSYTYFIERSIAGSPRLMWTLNYKYN